MIFTGVSDLSHRQPNNIDYKSICKPGTVILMNYCDEDEPMDDSPFSWTASKAENFPHSKAAVLVNLADTADALGYGVRFAEAPRSKTYPSEYFVSFKFTMKVSSEPGHGKQIKRIVNDMRDSLSRSSTIVRRDGLYVFRTFSDKRYSVSSTVPTELAEGVWRAGTYLGANGRRAQQRGHWADRIEIDDAVRYRVDNGVTNEVINVIHQRPAPPIRVRYLNQDWGHGDIVLTFADD